MHTVLKTTLIAGAIGAGLLSIDSTRAAASGPRIDEKRAVGTFSAIEVSGPFDITVQAGGAHGLTVHGERDQLEQVETFVRGDTLVVRPGGRTTWTFGYTPPRRHVTLSVSVPQLARLRMSGSGDVALDQVAGERIALTNDGPGDLRVAGQVRALALRVTGSGDAHLERLRASQVELTMAGPGDVELADIDGELQARIDGSGDLAAHRLALARLDLRLSGPGNAVLRGTVADFTAQVNGSGDLDGADLEAARAGVVLRGPGDVALRRVSDTLDADLRGSGDLQATLAGTHLQFTSSGPGNAELRGQVTTLRARLSGSGTFDGRRLQAGRADIAVTGPGTAKVHVTGQDGADRSRSDLLVVDRRGSTQLPD